MITTGPAKTYIAIVDDDESICRSLGRLLRAAGMHPVPYSSAEALLADNKQPRFECLVLDVQLGGMSGIELNQQLALSGFTAPGEVVLATIREAIRQNIAAIKGHA